MFQTSLSQEPHGKVRQYVRNAIILRELSAGDRLSPRNIMTELAVSRAVVKEALNDLIAQNWLMAHSTRDIRVRPVTRIDIDEVMQIRRSLECLVVELLMPTLGRRHFAYLDALLAQNGRASDAPDLPAELLGLDHGFHMYLVSLTNNSRLTQCMSSLYDVTLRLGIERDLDKPRCARCHSEHTAIVDALRHATLPAAREAVCRHLDAEHEFMLARLEKA